jgi:3-hydroxyacyl-[acyl-carrier-protein] dehydratase
MTISRIKEEIAQSMVSLKTHEELTQIAQFVFPEDFIGFRGHFPAKKILPGVCQIQCILAMFEQLKNKPLVLKEIIQVKFIQPVSPGEKITCICKNMAVSQNDFILKASIIRDDQRISDLKLRVSLMADADNLAG